MVASVPPYSQVKEMVEAALKQCGLPLRRAYLVGFFPYVLYLVYASRFGYLIWKLNEPRGAQSLFRSRHERTQNCSGASRDGQ